MTIFRDRCTEKPERTVCVREGLLSRTAAWGRQYSWTKVALLLALLVSSSVILPRTSVHIGAKQGSFISLSLLGEIWLEEMGRGF